MARTGSTDLEHVFGNIQDRIAQIERLLRGLAIPGAVVEDIITGVASAFSHNIIDLGVHTSFPGGTTDFLRADGVFATPSGVGGTVDVEDEGAPLGAAGTFDFVGAGVTATFAAGQVTITIPGGGGAGDEPTVSDWFLS